MDPALLQIDPLALDKEWLEQSGLFFVWAQKAVEARAEADVEKYNLDRLEAEISSDIRSAPDKYGIDKLTESIISQTIKLQKSYCTQMVKLIDTRRKAEELSKFSIALEQRRKALENLCFLHSQSYYGQPQEKPALIRKKRKIKIKRRDED
ncbi:MAG TPA: hypothetical protein PLI14_06515 [Bacilli bacterium]|jgi:hypothetical protein|nr:hypothetical protein [Bacilli bacterium]